MTDRKRPDRGGPESPGHREHGAARRSRRSRLLIGLALAAALAPVAAARTTHAAGGQSYVVTTTADPASCPDASGLSLRCALVLAQAGGGQDTITFNVPTPATISLGSTLVIDEPSGGSITVQGPGAAALTLDGQHKVQDLAVTGTVTLADLTVANGLAQGQAGFAGNGGGGGGGAAGLGGALLVKGGAVSVAGVTFTGNQAQGGAGGAGKYGFVSGGSGGGPTGGAGGAAGDLGGNGGDGGFASGGGGGGGLNGGSDVGGNGGEGGFGGFGGSGGGAFGIGGSGNGGGGGGAGLGGAIFVTGGTLTVTGSTFSGNSAVGGAGAPGATAPQLPSTAGQGLGGALFAYQGTVTVDACTSFADGADDHAVYQATFTTAPCATTTHITSSTNDSIFGQTVIFQATVAGGPGITPTGAVTFYDGRISLGSGTLSAGTATFSTTSLGAGLHDITAVYGGDGTDAGSTSADLIQGITPAPLTITANNQSMTYGGPAPTFDASYSFFVNSDTAASLTTLPTCTSVAANSPVGTYSITCGGAADPNYVIGYQPGTLTIGPAALTVTANNQSMTYGGSQPSFDAGYSGFVNGDTSSVVTTAPSCVSAPAGSPAGTYPITCGGAVAANYAINYVNGTLTVSPAPLTITAGSSTMVYNGTVPAITPSYGGFVNGDTAASLTTAPTCTSTAPSNGAAGAYATSCAGAVDPNYGINYVNGTLTITQAAQTIAFTALPNHTLGDAPFAVSASGGASGNPVTFSAGPSTVCTSGGTDGAAITLTGVGTCAVTANQAGNGNYQAASPVTQSFMVAYPALSLTLGLSSNPPGPVTTGSVVTLTYALGNHTSATQTVRGKATLTYTGSQGPLSFSVPFRLTLNAGQTLSQSTHFTIQSWFPRGAYTLSVTATDGSGDTASGAATLTVS